MAVKTPVLVRACLTLSLLAIPCLCRAADNDPAPDPDRPWQEYYHSFKGNPEITQDFNLDGLDPADCVNVEPEGLRMTFPTGHAGKRMGTGLATTFPVRGDFEITMSYEIVKEPKPADAGDGTALYLWADLNKPTMNRAMLSRADWPGPMFTIWVHLSDEGAAKPKVDNMKTFPTTLTKGRLRMVRTGSLLAHYVADAEGGEFTLLDEHPFGAEELERVRIGGYTGGVAAALDFRITDLRIRAQSLPTFPAAAPPPRKGRLAVALAAALAATFAAGVWLFARKYRRRPSQAAVEEASDETQTLAPPITFPCSGCGKRLKAGAEMAGRHVRCPSCGAAVLVPAAALPRVGDP